jgi:transposase
LPPTKIVVGKPAILVVAAEQEAIEAARAILLYLPQYSSDLNPIELAFSKLKALLSKAAQRTIPGLWRKIGSLFAAFSARECSNYFEQAGCVPK